MNKLITATLRHADTSFLLSIDKRLFEPLELSWRDFIENYTIRYGVPPTVERFEEEFSTTFFAVESKDPLEDIYDVEFRILRNRFAKASLLKSEKDLRDGADPGEIIEKIWDVISRRSQNCVGSEFDTSVYFRRVRNLPTAFSNLNAVTGGVNAGDFFIIYGRPGDGKTTLLLSMIAEWFKQGKRVLVISNEIPWDDIRWKIDALLAGFPLDEKRKGVFSDETLRAVRFLSYLYLHSEGEIITPKHPVNTPGEVQSLILQKKPDVVCIDGVYLMSPEGKPVKDWTDNAAVSRALKQIANKSEVPIVGIVQANREQEKSAIMTGGGIAGSDAYLQDADVVLGLRAISVNGNVRTTRAVTTKNRHGEAAAFDVMVDYKTLTVYERSET